MIESGAVDFAYPWWLSYGHAVILVPALAALVIGRQRRWGPWSMGALGVVAVWALASLFVLRAFHINGKGTLPTQDFLTSGAGRVLDIGAGTGRSSIMVLEARPQVTLVALDEFGHSFEEHFGPSSTPQQRLMANLKAAGVDQRATIETADMRKLPFPDGSFDGIISAYAIDHLRREGIERALAEAARVLKPGGDFLLMLVNNDKWTRFAFGPLLSHGGLRSDGWWIERVQQAGFLVAGTGYTPATRYLLLRR